MDRKATDLDGMARVESAVKLVTPLSSAIAVVKILKTEPIS